MSSDIRQYPKAFLLSQCLIDKLKIEKFPVDIFEVLKKKKGSPILCSTFRNYKLWAKSAGKKCPNEINDAKCYFDPKTDVYIIVYNEKKPENRIRFSIAHELGHIILGHLDDERTEINRGGLDDLTYYSMEGAANTFAGNLLAPPILIQERIGKSNFNVFDLSMFFKVSMDAIRTYRKKDYLIWLSLRHSKYEKNIFSRCKRYMFPHYCGTCNHTFYGKGFNYCPVCGNAKSSDYDGDGAIEMIYKGIEEDENFRATMCPKCNNEQIASDGTFCMICGESLINRCSEEFPPNRTKNCDNPLPGNARFCPYCGSESTFSKNGYLDPWNKPKEPELETEDVELPF